MSDIKEVKVNATAEELEDEAKKARAKAIEEEMYFMCGYPSDFKALKGGDEDNNK